jgi:hypothetical protein
VSAPFKFTPDQRRAVIKELKSELGISNLEQIVQDYRDFRRNRMAPAEIRDTLKETEKAARALRRKIESIAKKTQAPADWIVAPLLEYEHYAKALLDYAFRGNLKRGRPQRIPEIQLVQATRVVWVEIHGKEPSRSRGPFSSLVERLFEYSRVKGAPIMYPEEVVADALPPIISIRRAGSGELFSKLTDYPFTPLKYWEALSPIKRGASGFRVGSIADLA